MLQLNLIIILMIIDVRSILLLHMSAPFNKTIQIRVAMNDLNKRLTQILIKYERDTKTAIQQLFQLLATEPQQHHENIKKAILFSMENIHQWANIIKYTTKWKVLEYQRSFVDRMRKRLNEEAPAEQGDIVEEMKRLVEKYWKTRSPKKEENTYKEPINIKNLMRNINAQSLTPKDQHIFEQNNPPNQPIEQRPPTQGKVEPSQENKQQNLVKNQVNVQNNEKNENQVRIHRGESFGPQQGDSNTTSNALQKKQRSDPLANLTGRPPILKKKSIFQNNNRTNPIDTNEEKKKEEIKGRMPSTKIFNIMKRFGDKQEVKQTESWQNFGKNKESVPPIINKANEEFPADKFNFGSNKKVSGDIDAKKISISPRKYDPNTKAVRIVRDEPKEEKKLDILHQFSFASSEQKDSQGLPTKEPPTLKQPQPMLSDKNIPPQQQQFVFHDNAKESEKDEALTGENQFKSESFKRLKEVAQTPMFIFDSKKRRSSGGIRTQEIFEVDQALNLFHADVKLRYFMREIENRNGADTMTIFQEEFSRFLKDPEAFRV